ncbi:MAG: c-type cytochrome biogenesis protein CcmI [Gammaproteobacteria bacterium]|nr:MAG: c-type cytochrome biogenesis protein CcmI [Gammaproteobacteria bacterium]
MTTFLILAAAMLAVALAFPLIPLLRKRNASGGAAGADPRRLKALRDALAAGVIDEAEFKAKQVAMGEMPANATHRRGNRAGLWAAMTVAVLMPLGAILLYPDIGQPDAMDPQRWVQQSASPEHEAGVDMDQAVAGLVAKLEANPDNADGWALLGRAYQSMGKFAESRDALKRAHELLPDSHDLTVEYAQALALASEGRRIAGEPRQMLEAVLHEDPNHQRALWLIGISDYQAGDFRAAIDAWNRLLPALPAGSDIAESVRAQIAEAQKLAGIEPSASTPAAATPMPVPAAPVAQESATPTATSGPQLTLRVSLDPSLASQVKPDAVLFVFARAENGPPMPLAIQRLAASQLPTTLVLDDSMGMIPAMKLSGFPKVVVGARISASGNASAQAGDLQVMVSGVDTDRKEPLDLIINSVVP